MGKPKRIGRRRSDDPRKLHGAIVGPGGPHDFGEMIVDTRNAVLLDYTEVCTVDEAGAIAMLLCGKINRSTDRVEVLFLFGTDGAASIITQLIALLGRAGGAEFAAQFLDDIKRRTDELSDDGNLT